MSSAVASSAVPSVASSSSAAAAAKSQAPAPSSAKKSTRSSKPDKYEGNPDRDLPGIGNYMFLKTLGEGNFAKVKLAKHKLTGQEVAVKVIDKTKLDEKKLGKLYREVRIMKLLKHPNIVRLYEVVETKATVFLVMEYASGGELYDYLVVHGKMREKEARSKFRQILSAVSYCHKKRVIHRDLKAENLLLDANLNIKIADFGFSNYYDPDDKLDTFCGSPPYAAPELFQGRRYTGPEVDVWSLGVILYVLTTGCLPFDGKNLQEMRESVCRGKYRVPFYLSDNCEKLLRKFLVRDPARRASLDIVEDDPWINEGYNDSPVVTDISQNVAEDEEVIRIMETKFKIDRQTIYNSLRESVYDDVAAIYYLLYHERDMKNAENGDGQNTEPLPGAKSSSSSDRASNFAERRAASNGNLPLPKNAAYDANQAADQDEQTANAAVNAADVAGNNNNNNNGNVTDRSSAAGNSSASSASGHGAQATSNIPANAAANSSAAAAAAAAARKPRRRRFTVGGEADVLQYADDDDSRAAAEALKLKAPDAAADGQLPQHHHQQQQAAGLSLQKKLALAEEANNNSNNGDSNSGNYAAIGNTAAEDGVTDSSEVGPDGRTRRKRNNTFVGIIRSHIARRGNDAVGGSSSTNASISTNGSSTVSTVVPPSPGGPSAANPASGGGVQSSAASTDDDKPRALRFTFASNSTSSRPPDEVVQEVLNALDSRNIQYALPSRYLIAASALNGAVKFEIEICKLPRLNNLHGLRFKRLAGASADYKDICEQILSIVKL